MMETVNHYWPYSNNFITNHSQYHLLCTDFMQNLSALSKITEKQQKKFGLEFRIFKMRTNFCFA